MSTLSLKDAEMYVQEEWRENPVWEGNMNSKSPPPTCFGTEHMGTVYVPKAKGFWRALKRTPSFKFHCRRPWMTDELSSLLSLLPVEASLVAGGLRRIAHGATYVFMYGIPVEWNWIPISCLQRLQFSSHSPPPLPCLLGILSLSETVLSLTLCFSLLWGCAHTLYSARVSSSIFIYERLSKIFLPNSVLDRTAGMFS